MIDLDKDILALRLREKSSDLKDIWIDYGKSNKKFNLKSRLQHTVNEYNRVLELAKIISKNDIETKQRVKSIINASHDSLRDLFEVSVQPVDAIQAVCRKVSWGCRIVGAGFGGSLICIVDKSNMRIT